MVSHRDTELGRVLNDEVVTELALSAFPAGHQLGNTPECGDSRSRSLEGLRLVSVRHNPNIPETNDKPGKGNDSSSSYTASSYTERLKQDSQGEEDSIMEGGSPSRKMLIETSVPSFPLERILERQESPEGTADEDGKDEGGAGAAAASVSPRNSKREVSLPDNSLQKEENRPVILPVKYQDGCETKLTDRLCDTKVRDQSQTEMERVDTEKVLRPKQHSLR